MDIMQQKAAWESDCFDTARTNDAVFHAAGFIFILAVLGTVGDAKLYT